jgi:hypothetical protein
MKPNKLLLWIIIGQLLLLCGCARSMLQSSQLPIETVDKVRDLNMVYSLPKGMIHFKNDGKEVTVETVYVPDPEQYFTLAYLPRGSYDETVAVTVTSDLLLSQIEITSKPKIGEILMQALELGKAIAKLPIAFAKGEDPKNVFDVMIDPKVLLTKKTTKDVQELATLRDKEQELEAKVKTLQGKGKDITKPEQADLEQLVNMEIPGLKNQITNVKNKMTGSESLASLVTFTGIEDISLTRLFPTGNTQSIPSPTTGVKYRPLLPYRLEIRGPKYFFVKIVYLPNEAPIITLDVTRPAFAERVTKLSFTNGVLTKIDLTRPSEILAFAKIPVELVKAIAGLPMDLINFKVENVTANTNYLQAEINAIKAQQTLLGLQQQK